MPKRLREPGEFCWINVLTPGVEDAKAFFGALLGWTFEPIPGGSGWFIRLGESRFGGLFDLARPGTPPRTPPGVGVMARVDDADVAVARARALGGDARPALDVGQAGRMAELTAPDGARFAVWQPLAAAGTDVDPFLPGAPCWFEVVTRDVDRVSAFYRDLFGWTAERSFTDASGYVEFHCRGEMVAGLLPAPAEFDAPPHWGVYFTVKDVDATASRAVELGGSVVLDPRDIPGVGRFAVLRSPGGVAFHVVSYSI